MDKESAVNYLIFGNDQWVSYDDKVTFKQKVDWANEVGLGGGLVWHQIKVSAFRPYSVLFRAILECL